MSLSDSPNPLTKKLEQHLLELRLPRIAEIHREALDEAARKHTPLLETLAILFGEEVNARRERALRRRVLASRLLKPQDSPGIRLLLAPADPKRNHPSPL